MQSAIQLSQRMALDALTNEDLVSIRSARAETARTFDFIAGLIKDKASYVEWFGRHNIINSTSPFVDMDTTGEFKRLITELANTDGRAYYDEIIVPSFTIDLDNLETRREAMLAVYDDVIVTVIKTRRSRMHLVK